MRLLAIMLSRNEDDVIEDWLAWHDKWIDGLYCLDAGTDQFYQRVKDYAKLEYYATDTALTEKYTGTDGLRLWLQLEVWKREPEGVWLMIAHPDEFWIDNPRTAIQLTEEQKRPATIVRAYSYFLHTADRGVIDFSSPLHERMHYYMRPGWPEPRLLQLDRRYLWHPDLRYKVIPEDIPTWESEAAVAHYSFRTEAQTLSRAADRVDTAWSPNDGYRTITAQNSGYLDMLPNYPDGRVCDDRHEPIVPAYPI